MQTISQGIAIPSQRLYRSQELMNVFSSRSCSFEMNNSTEDIETIVNFLGNSMSSLDIDKVFHDDQSSGHRCGKGTREMRQRMFQVQRQHGATGNTVGSVFLNKSITIPDGESAFLERPGSLAKFDRGSTLGSFSVFTGSSDDSLREIPEQNNSNSDKNNEIFEINSNNLNNKISEIMANKPADRVIDLSGNNSSLDEAKCISSSLSRGVGGNRPGSFLLSRESSGLCHGFVRESSERTMMTSNVTDNLDLSPYPVLSSSSSIPIATTRNNTKSEGSTRAKNEFDEVNNTSNDNHDDTQQPDSPIAAPHMHDVLMGRGGRNNQWSGNELLRTLAYELSDTYSTASKRAKPTIAWILVTKMRALQPPGRFLKHEPATGVWLEVEDGVAREKASQCLRDIVAARTKTGHLKLGNEGNSLSETTLTTNMNANTEVVSDTTLISAESAGMHRSSSYLSKRNSNSAPDIQVEIVKRQRTATMNSSNNSNAVFPVLPMQHQQPGLNFDWLYHGQQSQQQRSVQAESLPSRSTSLQIHQSSPSLHSMTSTSSDSAFRNLQLQSLASNCNYNDFNTRQNGTGLSAGAQERLLRQLQSFTTPQGGNSNSVSNNDNEINRLMPSFWQDSRTSAAISRIYSGETTFSAAQQEHELQQRRLHQQQQMLLKKQLLRQGN